MDRPGHGRCGTGPWEGPRAHEREEGSGTGWSGMVGAAMHCSFLFNSMSNGRLLNGVLEGKDIGAVSLNYV